MKTIKLEAKCEGDEKQMIEYLKNEIIPRLEGGHTSGYETWYRGWVADLQGNHSGEGDDE
jgi:hypothetical protein